MNHDDEGEVMMSEKSTGRILYHNPLMSADDVSRFRMEGPGVASFPQGRMRLESTASMEEGQASNLVFWCPEIFPDYVSIQWQFRPLCEPGLAILFFSATGSEGRDLFDSSLSPRNGPYDQYHHGDIHALHVSYFRRRHPAERAFSVCNLRKSYGFHMVAQGADPLPTVADMTGMYTITVCKSGPRVTFRIADPANTQELEIFRWEDDGTSYGPILEGGRIGFRQMCPLIAEYANLTVSSLPPC